MKSAYWRAQPYGVLESIALKHTLLACTHIQNDDA